MEFLALAVTCPGCGSEDVAYSCHPDCCFNHVCGTCLNSFELFTEDTGETFGSAEINAVKKDSCEPTAACARCGSLSVCRISSDGRASSVVCAACHALLHLKFD